MFNTSLDRIFGVKKYADALTKIVKERDIKLNFKRNLFAIKPGSKEAVFEVLDDSKSEKKLETYEVGLQYCNVMPLKASIWIKNLHFFILHNHKNV